MPVKAKFAQGRAPQDCRLEEQLSCTKNLSVFDKAGTDADGTGKESLSISSFLPTLRCVVP